MKTKKFVVLAALIVSGILFNVSNANAQKSDNVTLNIKLTPIQTITVNPASDHQTVDLEYKSVSDYAEGKTAVRPDHLEIFSTGGFSVSFKASAENFTTSTGTGTIAVGEVSIFAENGSNVLGSEKYDGGQLTVGGTTLLSSNTGGRDLNYNVTYDNTAGNEDAYIDHISKGKEATYTTEVTYTIVAQ